MHRWIGSLHRHPGLGTLRVFTDAPIVVNKAISLSRRRRASAARSDPVSIFRKGRKDRSMQRRPDCRARTLANQTDLWSAMGPLHPGGHFLSLDTPTTRKARGKREPRSRDKSAAIEGFCKHANWSVAVIVTSFPKTVRVIEHTLIPLKDGTMLAARIWLPDDAERNPVPAILEYLPYRKRDGTYERDALTHPYLAGHGYAGVRVDIRGSGESSGLLFDEYAKAEQDDGLEVIAWLAAQPWCSGVVGMMGISWGGFNALQIAARRPPALKAIVTLCSTDDRYADDAHYMGGTLLTAGLDWGAFFFGSMCLPPDPMLVGQNWRAMWLERLENVPLFFERWLQHQRRDAYWKHASVCEDYSAIQCPVYAVGGWTDGYTNSILRLLERLQVPRKGLIGPWAHAYPHFALPGPQICFLQEMLRWWDHWLKGIDTGVMHAPMLRAWMTDSVKPAQHHEVLPGRWVGEPSWPAPGISRRRLFLADAGLRTEPAPLTVSALSSPQTVGRCGGDWVPFGRGHDQAGDQQEDDTHSLIFETPPLETAIEILGAAFLTLEVASDRPLANLAVRLCDVHPTGNRCGSAMAFSTSLTATDTSGLERWRSQNAIRCASSSTTRARASQPGIG